MEMRKTCIVCQGAELAASIRRKNQPAMQNVMYESALKAGQCKLGDMLLTTCRNCGHTFNCLFNSSLVEYDSHYDNSVPSRVMDGYLREISEYICAKYELKDQLVLDIGCGKGELLREILTARPGVSGIGIDPSLRQTTTDPAMPRLRLIADRFKPEYLDIRPSLLICRHVLEHIPEPPRFLREIRAGLASCLPVPFFIEVRDLNWIVETHAFYRFLL